MLTDLELASGMVLGQDPQAAALPEVDPVLSPLEALSRAIVPYLERPPCLVSFSGGRDSSVVLAVATAVARREGLELPIAMTQRFPNAADAEESAWQEAVIQHLRLSDWVRTVLLDELDWIGPIAREVLVWHGVLYPPNAFFMVPMLREARGGTLLTGVDGDSLFRTWRWERAASVLARRVRPTRRDVLRIGVALAPPRVRAWRLERKEPLDLPWLRIAALELVKRRFYQHLAAEPFRWGERVRWFSQQRRLAVAVRSLRLIAEQNGAAIAHPLLAPGFLAALARAGRVLGFGDVPTVMRTQFGSLLPSDAIGRTSKASFGEVFCGPYSRDFIASWRGQHVPQVQTEFVDEQALFNTWRQAGPDATSAMLLQALWLARRRERGGSVTREQGASVRPVDP